MLSHSIDTDCGTPFKYSNSENHRSPRALFVTYSFGDTLVLCPFTGVHGMGELSGCWVLAC